MTLHQQNHPLELNGVLHASWCAVWFTPANSVQRRPCNCWQKTRKEICDLQDRSFVSGEGKFMRAILVARKVLKDEQSQEPKT